jgi:alpha-tubulin suppressor-like RCC1 family protein
MTQCQTDRNSNGLPDNWELQYFGDLEQSASDDPDDDGLTNLQEYQNGTNPTLADVVAAPVMSPAGGTFAARQNVTVTCATPGATIHYTFNGTDPTDLHPYVLSGETIPVTRSGPLKIKAFKSGWYPSAVQSANFTVTGAIAAGRKHTLALKSDGTVLAAGSNGNGQDGDGTTHLRTTLGAVSGLPSAVVGIAAGQLFSMAWTASGEAWMWGGNENGQLGNDQMYHHQTTPIQVPISDVIAMSGGNQHTLALKSGGSVWAWGLNYNYQLGDGTGTRRTIPVQVKKNSQGQYLTEIVAIAAGGTHSLALSADGKVWAWGHGTSGQLGNGGAQSLTYPVRVTKSDGTDLIGVKAIAAGLYHSVALTSDGKVWAWGRNDRGQLGTGNTQWKYRATQVTALSDIVAISVAAGGYSSLALDDDGAVWTWGDNQYGQLGDCTSTPMRTTPVQVSGLNDAIAIAACRDHGIALKLYGNIATWGWLNYGEEVNFNPCPVIPEPDMHLTDNDDDLDGLVDWWEIEHFGDLNESAAGDYDEDGISNLQELQEGTDPNTIRFHAHFHARYVNSPNIGAELHVLGGVPSDTIRTNRISPPRWDHWTEITSFEWDCEAGYHTSRNGIT